jgi:hypothetical protein
VRIAKRETPLKQDLFDVLEVPRATYVPLIVPIQDVRKGGTPDFTFNVCNKTSWWEVKHATPHFDSPRLQEITCERLAKTSFCRYIIYVDAMMPYLVGPHKQEQFVVILDPKHVARKHGKLDRLVMCSEADVVIGNFDHEKVADAIWSVHTR